MPSSGDGYYVANRKLAELWMYLSDMMLDGRMSEDDYNKVIPMITSADEGAFHQTLYITETIGYEEALTTGIFSEAERAYRNLGVNEESGSEDMIYTAKLNDPDFEGKNIFYAGEDEWGEPIFKDGKGNIVET